MTTSMRWTEKKAESFMKRYPRQFKLLENSPSSKLKKGGMSVYDICALGEQLDQFSLMVKIEEAQGNVSNLGPLPKIGLDVITAYFGVTPLPQVCGIQPIDEPIGLVWFKDVLAKTTRGNVTIDQVLASPLGMPEVWPENFSTDTLINSNFYHHTSNGAQTGTDVSLGGSDSLVKPIDPQRCVISGSAIFNGGADEATFRSMIVDPDDGHFSGVEKVNGTNYYIAGDVNFVDGTVTYAFSADPSGATDLYAEFGVLLESATDIPQQLLVMQAKPVKARFFALKSTYGFAQSYMMNKRWGMSAEGEMTRDLTAAVNNEVFNLVLSKLKALVPDNAKLSWGRQPGSGVSYFEHIMTLPAALTDASALLTNNLGRGSIKVLIAGLKAAAVLENHPKFVKQFDDDSLGPHVYGTFDGKPVIRCPANAQLDQNKIIGVWKGSNPFEAPVVWAPYMPLTMTEVQGTGTNPLQRQRAAAIWGAIDTMIPNGLCQVTVDQTSFDYGAQGS